VGNGGEEYTRWREMNTGWRESGMEAAGLASLFVMTVINRVARFRADDSGLSFSILDDRPFTLTAGTRLLLVDTEAEFETDVNFDASSKTSVSQTRGVSDNPRARSLALQRKRRFGRGTFFP